MISKRPLGSAEFFAQCARIAALAEANAAEKEKPGALGLLICDYRKSPAFQDLAPKTKHDYQAVFDYLRPIADTPLVRFDLPVVVRIRDKAALKGRRFGNYVKAVLSLLFKWGSQRDFLANNPASGIKDLQRKKDAPEANRSWSDQEREAVLEGSPDHMRPAIALMMFTGLGPKDALTLPRNFAKGGEIATRGAKTGAPVFWDMPCPLGPFSTKRLTISAITHCANSRGRPWSLSGINASWRTVRIRLEKEGRIGAAPDALWLAAYRGGHSARDRLRRAHDRRRARAKDDRNGAHYAKGADLRGKMGGVAKNFDAELAKRATKVVNPD